MYNGYLLTDEHTLLYKAIYINPNRGILQGLSQGILLIILRPRYAYIIILYNYNIIYIIFPRLLLFPSSTLCLGKILWPSSYFSTQDSFSVCTSVSVSVSVLFEEKPILLLGKNLLLFYFGKTLVLGKNLSIAILVGRCLCTFYSFIFGKTHFLFGKKPFYC